jgi:hypothetical protein
LVHVKIVALKKYNFNPKSDTGGKKLPGLMDKGLIILSGLEKVRPR